MTKPKPTLALGGQPKGDLADMDMKMGEIDFAHIRMGGVEGFVAFGVLEGRLVAAAGPDPSEALLAMFQVAFPAMEKLQVAAQGVLGFGKMMGRVSGMSEEEHDAVPFGGGVEWGEGADESGDDDGPHH